MREIADSELAAVVGAIPCGFAEYAELNGCEAGCSELIMPGTPEAYSAFYACMWQCQLSMNCDP